MSVQLPLNDTARLGSNIGRNAPNRNQCFRGCLSTISLQKTALELRSGHMRHREMGNELATNCDPLSGKYISRPHLPSTVSKSSSSGPIHCGTWPPKQTTADHSVEPAVVAPSTKGFSPCSLVLDFSCLPPSAGCAPPPLQCRPSSCLQKKWQALGKEVIGRDTWY